MGELRRFMFERIYLGPIAQREAERIHFVIRTLFDRLCAHPDEIPDSSPDGELPRRVTDYLAGMTDRFCLRAFEAVSVPSAFAP
jgi:dGTPase